MNVREAMETISGYIDMLYSQGVFTDREIFELQDAECAIYEFLNAMEV
jgi:hypothetical protein